MFRKKALIKALNDWNYCNLKIYFKRKKIHLFHELPYSLFMSFTGTYYHFDGIWQFRDGYATPNLSNDYLKYVSRFVTFFPKNIFKKSKAVQTLKKYMFKNLKKNISKNNFQASFNDIVDFRYKKDIYTDNYKKYFFHFKFFLRKYFNFFFLIFKKINYFFSFILSLCSNKYFIKFPDFLDESSNW